MKTYFVVVKIVFLVLYFEKPVESRPKHGVAYGTLSLRSGKFIQITFPLQKPEESLGSQVSLITRVNEKEVIPHVRCQRYKQIVIANVYNRKGIWIDSMILPDLKAQSCDGDYLKMYSNEVLDSTIYTVIYLFKKSHENTRCKKREYITTAGDVYAIVERQPTTDVDCPAKVTQLLTAMGKDGDNFGVEKLLPDGTNFYDMEYINDKNRYVEEGKPETKMLDSNNEFMLICQNYVLRQKPPKGYPQDNTHVAYASIVIKNTGLVVDRFRMTSCSSYNIQIRHLSVEGMLLVSFMSYQVQENNRVKYPCYAKVNTLETSQSGDPHFVATGLTVGDANSISCQRFTTFEIFKGWIKEKCPFCG